MKQSIWMLCAASALASAAHAAPSGETLPTRNYVLSGEILIYSPRISALPASTVVAQRGARSEADLLLRVESLSAVTDDLARFDSGALVHGQQPLMLGELGGSPLELGDLSLHRDASGWTFYAEGGEMKARPILSMPDASSSVNRISENEFVLSGELQLHEAMAAELGLEGSQLPPSLVVGSTTLHASTYPGVRAAVPSAQVVKWTPTVASSALSVAGPDVVVSTIGGTTVDHGTGTGGTVGTITAYSVTTVSCNIGTQDAEWFNSGTSPGSNHHPVIGTQIYRLKTVAGSTRFEQLGLSWLKHGSCAADAPNCGSPYTPNGSCQWLGLFATDTYGSGLNGSQSNLGPRSEIQPWTGVYPYPYILGHGTGDAIFKRTQVQNADLDPAQNAGASYWTEVVYICTDEPDSNRYNNYSNRTTTVGTITSGGYNLALTGTTNWQQSAIEAWKIADPSVTIATVDVPGDGRFLVAGKATNLGGNQWHYEYAVFNMNCNDSAYQVRVPTPAAAVVTNQGFHDVPYHSGEPYSSVDWTSGRTSSNVEWATSPFSVDPNANALRWSTTYNFRFDANITPTSGNVEIGLFRSGGTAFAVGLPVPDNFPVPYCFGDGTGTACPCGNAGISTNGCGNSAFASGAQLGSTGLPHIGSDDLVLTSTSAIPFGPGLYFQGSAQLAAGSPFGNGLICVGGATPRIEVRFADAAGASATTVAIHALGGDVAGDVRYYQMWYRDGTGFCTGAGFNLTNALALTWTP